MGGGGGGGGVAYFGNFQGYVFLGRNSLQFSKLMGNQPVLVAIVTSEALFKGWLNEIFYRKIDNIMFLSVCLCGTIT